MRWAQGIAAWLHVARTNGSLRTAKSCGPDTPTLVSSAVRLKRIVATWWPTSPGHQGDHVYTVPPVGLGRPRVVGHTCGTSPVHFFRRRATGAASARPSLRPPPDSRADLMHI